MGINLKIREFIRKQIENHLVDETAVVVLKVLTFLYMMSRLLLI